MAKKKADMSDAEMNRYWDSYFATVDTQTETKSKLEELEDSTGDLGERSGYRADRLRVEADIELLRAKRIAYNANSASVNPPTDEQVKALQELASKVANETAKRNRAKAIIGFATTAMTQFSAIQSKP